MDAVDTAAKRINDGDGGEGGDKQRKVGILYDERMCKHYQPDGEYHPENPNRIKAIWKKLQDAGIPQRCVVLEAKEAEDKHILAVHSANHVKLIKNISLKEFDSRRNRIASKLNSIYFNEGSSEAAYLAAGSVIDVAERVAKDELNSAVAIVRPPGHHAEEDEAMGFCLYNNVAIATSFLLNERSELGIKKILIVDWDVHHGNATQKMFWKDPRVLFFSIHRHEFGGFYPCTDDGFYSKIGEGAGAGYNINVPWENARCGDADYLAVWDYILLPVAKEYNPDLVIVSAGFDAALGDPLGGCRVTPYGYSIMLKKLMTVAQGKVVLALEGGYNLDSIANSTLACMKVLLGENPINGSAEGYPFESTWHVIQLVRRELSPFWPVLADELPKELISRKTSLEETVVSNADSEDDEDSNPKAEIHEDIIKEVVEPLSRLNVDDDSHDRVTTASELWRDQLSKTDIWYASFGSNMWKPRFLCYIEGGQVEGMKRAYPGAMDKTPPKEIMWKTFPHQLTFGHESTRSWGPGGVAFVDPESNVKANTYMCLYRITLEQFNDVLIQENAPKVVLTSPLLDLAALDSMATKEPNSLEIPLEYGWYHGVLYLGKEQDLPILTITCTHSDIEGFRSGKLPSCAPSKSYADTLVKGLVEGGQLSKEEAIAYIYTRSFR